MMRGRLKTTRRTRITVETELMPTVTCCATSDGQPVVRQVMLQPGHAAFLQINGSEFVGSEGTRINFRPLVRVFQSPPDPNRALPPDPCVPTLEIIENGTGRTSLLFAGTPNLQPPPEPDRQ